MAKTKILATIGPASFDKVKELIEAGADGFRFNFAHIREENYLNISNIVESARNIKRDLFFVGDLEGPKLRLGYFETVKISSGEEVVIIPASSGEKGIPIQFNDFYKYVKKGRLILVDDGKVGLRIKFIDGSRISCSVEYGELLEARKGINTPDMIIPMEYMTDKMKRDTMFMVENRFSYISASFSRTAQDIRDIRKFAGKEISIKGKVENCEGTENLDEIIEEADAMMVPRGDWGMEMGVMNVPAYQKLLIEKCNVRGKPVTTATQMLESMMVCKEPSRAEVSDIFNAVLDGTDVVMLSGETSKGKYPTEAVRMMDRILDEAERYLFDKKNGTNLSEKLERLIKSDNPADLISRAVYTASKSDDIKLIVTPTSSGYTARMIARFRGEKPIIAVTYDNSTMSKLSAIWGVTPLLMKEYSDKDSIVENAIATVKNAGFIHHGDNIIVTSGLGNNGKGSTNMMQIRMVD